MAAGTMQWGLREETLRTQSAGAPWGTGLGTGGPGWTPDAALDLSPKAQRERTGL